MRLWRFRIGRALIHAGLRIMPEGRVRSELYGLMDQWATKVRDTVHPLPRPVDR